MQAQTLKQMMFDKIDSLKTPSHQLARAHLLTYALMFNKEIEPLHDYADKFFTILAHEYHQFKKSSKDLFILEASPRTGKTDFTVNIFATQLLGELKNKRFLFIGSNQILKKKLRRQLERVIRSPLFYKMYPDCRIDISNESEMILTNGNVINFTTTYSAVPTGEGYHWIFLIDFLSVDTMRSTAMRDEAFAQLSGFLSRTQNNPTTKIIVDNQRLGVEDLSHYLVSQYEEMQLPYTRLTFPFQFEDDYSYKIGKVELKFKKGEYLVSRFNEFEKRKIIARLGEFVYETQYLQKPRRARGDLVKREMFRFYNHEELRGKLFNRGYITTDLALENKKKNDYNVYCYWLVDVFDNVYLVDMLRLKIKGLESEKALYNFYLKWKDGLKNGGPGCNAIYFEDTTNTKMTIQRYENGLEIDGKKIAMGGLVKKLARTKNKFSRFIDSLPHLEAGKVFLPGLDVKLDGVVSVQDDVVEPFIREYENFREDMSHDNDDIVDCGTDAINIARQGVLDLSVSF